MDKTYRNNNSRKANCQTDGRTFGKMGHCDRTSKYVLQNVPGDIDQKNIASGVRYFG